MLLLSLLSLLHDQVLLEEEEELAFCGWGRLTSLLLF
jgi:hypothetical protein